MEAVLTGEPIPKVDPILVLEQVLEMDPIPQIPIPAQNTVIPCPIIIPAKSGNKTSLVHSLIRQSFGGSAGVLFSPISGIWAGFWAGIQAWAVGAISSVYTGV